MEPPQTLNPCHALPHAPCFFLGGLHWLHLTRCLVYEKKNYADDIQNMSGVHLIVLTFIKKTTPVGGGSRIHPTYPLCGVKGD